MLFSEEAAPSSGWVGLRGPERPQRLGRPGEAEEAWGATEVGEGQGELGGWGFPGGWVRLAGPERPRRPGETGESVERLGEAGSRRRLGAPGSAPHSPVVSGASDHRA